MTKGLTAGDDITPLTGDEIDGIAMRLVVDHLRWNPGDVAEWENVPRLTEGAWAAVVDAIDEFRRKLARDLRQWESLHDIDTVELLERAQ